MFECSSSIFCLPLKITFFLLSFIFLCRLVAVSLVYKPDLVLFIILIIVTFLSSLYCLYLYCNHRGRTHDYRYDQSNTFWYDRLQKSMPILEKDQFSKGNEQLKTLICFQIDWLIGSDRNFYQCWLFCGGQNALVEEPRVLGETKNSRQLRLESNTPAM